MNLKNLNIGLNGKPIQFKQVSLNGNLFIDLDNKAFVNQKGKKIIR